MEFNWSVDSAIWQMRNGRADTRQTASAWVFIETMARGASRQSANEMANDDTELDF